MSIGLKVYFLTDLNEDPSLHEALQCNMLSAACCAAILMGDSVKFTSMEFFDKVAGLSYTGIYRNCEFLYICVSLTIGTHLQGLQWLFCVLHYFGHLKALKC